MKFKHASPTPGMIRALLSVVFLLYLPFPVYVVGLFVYGHLRLTAPSFSAAICLLAVLVTLGLLDVRKARHGKWTEYSSVISFVQLCISLAMATIFVASAHGNAVVFRIWLILPAFACAILGDAVFMTIVGALTLVALGLVTQATYHDTSTTAWTLGIWGPALASVMLGVHVVIDRFVGQMQVQEALRRLSDHGLADPEWPRDLLDALGDVAAALKATELEVLAADAQHMAVPVHLGGWPAPATCLEVGRADVRSTLAEGAPLRRESTVLVPVKVAVEPQLVVAARVRPDALASLYGSDLGIAQTVAALLVAMCNRALLVEALQTEVRTDPLTVAANRRAFDEFIDRELVRALRTGDPLSIAMLDLDHFKRYNDEFGHLAGDDILRDAARRMRSRTRASDLVARYGGEEFALVLPSTDLPGAVALVESIRELGPMGVPDWPITFSAGVAQWDGHEGRNDLVRRSDAALYEAKRSGRDCVVKG